MEHGRWGFDEASALAFAEGALGGAVSPEVHALIAEAGSLRAQPAAALALLERARAAAPRHPVPLIALYRFHFYGHRLAQARAVGEDALAVARMALGAEFGDQPPADEAVRHDPAVRFYLFTLKGLAYLNLRLGAFDEAQYLLGALRRLDPQDHVGGALLAQVLARHLQGDAALAQDLPPEYPLRGWSTAP
ncbi:hypothetical protein [Extensimonas perlucida]|uniref:hypothetical protein n=1 Tax=Extensimonas perlucida TaxID=2590786 RepID=UPI0011A94505|nr:hypothetical protein [Extensimonas perlucida]